ncbi:MAG: hypothetical protein HY351_01860 [Candidatus Omnitrophica bacterium]|nr:hypothetical protein [Candidatus Omnitrophota bacterium]
MKQLTCCLAMTILFTVLSASQFSLFAQDEVPQPPAIEQTAEEAEETAPQAPEEEVPGVLPENNLPFRDPFQSNLPSDGGPTFPGETPVEIIANLEGISISGEGSLAIINGELYHEGETKGGVQVTQIKKKEVDIIVNGLSQTLRMVPAMRASTSPLDEVNKEGSSQTVEGSPVAEGQLEEVSQESSLEREEKYV